MITSTNSLNDILEYINEQTLVVSDIENVLIKTSLIYDKQSKKLLEKHSPFQEETKKHFLVVHTRAPLIIGATARSYKGTNDDTNSTLRKLFGQSFKGFHHLSIPYTTTQGFYKGCLFTSGSYKGPYLSRLLHEDSVQKLMYANSINRIVFIDDSYEQCNSVMESLSVDKVEKNSFIKDLVIFNYVAD